MGEKKISRCPSVSRSLLLTDGIIWIASSPIFPIQSLILISSFVTVPRQQLIRMLQPPSDAVMSKSDDIAFAIRFIIVSTRVLIASRILVTNLVGVMISTDDAVCWWYHGRKPLT